jgi:hypothetical protein
MRWDCLDLLISNESHPPKALPGTPFARAQQHGTASTNRKAGDQRSSKSSDRLQIPHPGKYGVVSWTSYKKAEQTVSNAKALTMPEK